jgi:hypothetical protein
MNIVLVLTLSTIALASIGSVCFMAITAQRQRSYSMFEWYLGILVLVVTVMTIIGVIMYKAVP